MSGTTLYLLRHAKSAWDTDAPTDFERPLAQRGRQAAKRVGKWMKAHQQLPLRVISSPAVRAAQTIEIICKHARLAYPEVCWEPALYDTGAGEVYQLIKRNEESADSVMLVGHNPTTEDLLRLLADRSLERFEQFKLVPTACLVRLDLDGAWSDWQPGKARVDFILRPRDLE